MCLQRLDINALYDQDCGYNVKLHGEHNHVCSCGDVVGYGQPLGIDTTNMGFK